MAGTFIWMLGVPGARRANVPSRTRRAVLLCMLVVNLTADWHDIHPQQYQSSCSRLGILWIPSGRQTMHVFSLSKSNMGHLDVITFFGNDGQRELLFVVSFSFLFASLNNDVFGIVR